MVEELSLDLQTLEVYLFIFTGESIIYLLFFPVI